MITKKAIVILGVALTFGSPCLAGDTTKLTGVQLKVCAVAFAEFSKAEQKADIHNYTVEILESSESYEVVFAPNHPVGESTVRGGETKFGKEIHYVISKKTFKITRTFFGR